MNFYKDLDIIFSDNEYLQHLKILIIEAYEKNKLNKSNYVAKNIISTDFKFVNGDLIPL